MGLKMNIKIWTILMYSKIIVTNNILNKYVNPWKLILEIPNPHKQVVEIIRINFKINKWQNLK